VIRLLPKDDNLWNERDTALREQVTRQAAGGISDNDGHKILQMKKD
jgi:hypothetical protein